MTELVDSVTTIEGVLVVPLRRIPDERGTIFHMMERFLGPDDYSLVVIRPLVWTGLKGMTDIALVANCATHPHDPIPTHRLDPLAGHIPYDWSVRHR